jgi:hypothetical protein
MQKISHSLKVNKARSPSQYETYLSSLFKDEVNGGNVLSVFTPVEEVPLVSIEESLIYQPSSLCIHGSAD